MSSQSNKRGDRRKKRAQSKRDRFRLQAISPYKRAARTGEIAACYINEGWDDDGFASMLVLRRVGDSGLVLAAFYSDLWCCGLKDAWGRLDITMHEFEEDVYGRFSRDVNMLRVQPSLIRRLVGGGIRFARQNGFRLPPRYERWVSILGDVDASDAADLSDYGFEDGMLHFVGNLEDLRRRLIGCSVEEFLKREDVHFTIGEDDFSLLDDAVLGTEEVAESVQSHIIDGVRKWCFANGRAPHPRLPDAAALLLDALLQMDDDDVIETAGTLETTCHSGSRNVETLLKATAEPERRELIAAVEQLMEFVEQYPTPAAMIEDLMPDAAGSADS